MYQKTKQPGNKPTAPDTQAEERSLEDRLRKRAEQEPIKKTSSALLQIIEIRDFLIDERRSGRTSDDLAGFLASEGINITPGTLRNYRAQIERAIISLENEGKEKPSNADIHRRINAIEKAARTSGTSEAQQAPTNNIAQTATTPSTSDSEPTLGQVAAQQAGDKAHDTAAVENANGMFGISEDRT